MFISFEGIDGSGKSTQAAMLRAALEHLGYTVVSVREPGGTQLGEQVRSLLLDPDTQVSARAELLLFSAVRAQLAADVIRPSLEQGSIVIADRFFDSSTAYQIGGRQLAVPGGAKAFHAFVTDGLVPDRTYVIDVDLATGASRRGQTPDRMESSGDAFYRRVRDSYLALSQSSPQRVLVVDGSRPPEAVHQAILRDVERGLDQTK